MKMVNQFASAMKLKGTHPDEGEVEVCGAVHEAEQRVTRDIEGRD